MLKKEKQKSREYNPNKYTPIISHENNGGGARENGDESFNGRDSRNSRTSRNSKIENEAKNNSETDLTADLSLGKKEAFEEFRNYFYKDGQHYESQKNQLKEMVQLSVVLQNIK